MKSNTVGFIGGGRIVRIMLEGWSRAGSLPNQIIVSDTDTTVLQALRGQFPTIVVSANVREAAASDIVFLAVHPPALPEVAESIAAGIRPDALVVSLAPKLTLKKLAGLLVGFSRLIRCIPNAPSVMGLGFNPVTYSSTLTAQDRASVIELLIPLGLHPEVAEEKLEAYAVLTAMGPTYLWFQFQALREIAGEFGLDHAEADLAVDAMVGGTLRTLLDSQIPPAEVMDLIPVKPFSEKEAEVDKLYRTRLPGIYDKIRP